MEVSPKHLIIIAGPTGVGKTKVGIELAQQFNTEIISADSRQLYKEMCIGTAVPSTEELAAVKHHFVQCISVEDYYNASMYEEQVVQKLGELFQVHNIVFMVGGTGMYIDAVCNGIDQLPTIEPSIRKKYQDILANEGIEKIRELLQACDPAYYAKVDTNNPMRMLKGLEVTDMTGKPYSEHLTSPAKERPFDIVKIIINTDREVLYSRINQRVLTMMDAGLLSEVRTLSPYKHLNPLKTVGYREIFEHLEGAITLDEAIEKIQNHSRAYARRQITWFRRDSNAHWFNPNEIDSIKKHIDG